MKEEKETVNGVEVPSRERIAATEQTIRELWDCAAKLGTKPHFLLSIGYHGDIDWTVSSLSERRFCGKDPVELLRQIFPSEEERELRNREQKKAELLACENRANELRKELSELCEK